MNETLTQDADKKTPWLKIQLLSIAGGLSYMGSTMTTFAVILRDKDVVGPTGVSIIFLAMLIPNILMAPVSGQIADRFQARVVTPIALTMMSLSTLSIALVNLSWWAPVALFTTATFGTMVGASVSATVGSVSRREDMTRVTGIQQTFVSVGSLAGPATAGLLVSATGYFWPFVIDSVSFLILAGVFLALGLNRKPMGFSKEDKPRALDGFRFLFRSPLLSSIILLLAVVILALGVISVGEVFLIVDELGASTVIYGIIGALFSGGAVIGAVILQGVKVSEEKQSWGLVASLLVMVLSLTSLSLAPNWIFAGVIYLIAGMGNAGVNIFAIGQIQRRAKEEVRGRIMAAVQGTITSANALSLGMGGLLIGFFGVREVFFAAGILALAALAIFGPRLLRASRA